MLPEEIGQNHSFSDEWEEYVETAQGEMGMICSMIQQSVEIRLKAIICEESPYLLLINSGIRFNGSDADTDFTQLRTIDAVDLPRAVRALTNFQLQESYLKEYGDLRRLRNQVTHLGSHSIDLRPSTLIRILAVQFIALWPDARWLIRRTEFDGQSAQRYFQDGRYSSVESVVMNEMPYTVALLDNNFFKSLFGVKKSALKGFCPNCTLAVARKSGVDAVPTAFQISAETATCAMCESLIELHESMETCGYCSTKVIAVNHANGAGDSVCFGCGEQ